MKKRKFLLAANRACAEKFAVENELGPKDYVVIYDDNQLRGIDSKTIEFVYLDGWYLNTRYNEQVDDIIRHHVILGAKKTYL